MHLPGRVPSEDPVSAVKFFDEQNVQDRVLTREEFQRMLDAALEYLMAARHQMETQMDTTRVSAQEHRLLTL